MKLRKSAILFIFSFLLFACQDLGTAKAPPAGPARNWDKTLAVPAPEGKWWESAVFYQIFPLSYFDSDDDKYGDLKGITAKLDYLKYLGVSAVWLTPFHPVPKSFYHGYAVSDYYGVNPDLGTMQDFETLVKEAHTRGIKIVMDFVMNHAAAEHPWFVDSATKKNSPYADYFVWKKSDPGGWANATGNSRMPAWNVYDGEGARKGEVFYAAFNFTIPDFNHTNPKVQAEMRKIAKFWLDKGVDGFRIDAARYLIETGPGNGQTDTPETIKYIKDFCAYCKSINPNTYIIAEVYTGMDTTKTYYQGDPGLDAVFDFDFGGKGGVIQGSLQTGKTAAFSRVMTKFESVVKKDVPQTFFSLYFSNHDSGRMPETLRYPEKVKAAAAMFFTMPGGAPYIYYGDEIGMREGVEKIGDAQKRNPMQWDSSENAGFTKNKGTWTRGMKPYYMDPATAPEKYQKSAVNDNVAAYKEDPQSSLQLFRILISFRKKYKSLNRGDFAEVNIDMDQVTSLDKDGKKDKEPFISFIRYIDDEAVLVLVNPGKTAYKLDADINSKIIKGAKWKVEDAVYSPNLQQLLPPSIENALLNGKYTLTLQSRDFIIVVLKKVKS